MATRLISIAKPTAQPHFDGWSNQVTGLGTLARDKRMASQFDPDYFTQPELELMYRGNDLAARIVDILPDDMVRMGFEVIGDDKDVAEAVSASLGQGNNTSSARLQALVTVHKGLKWKRAYGGSGVLLGVDDGQDPIMPLDESKIRSFKWMTVLTPEELQPASRYTNALGGKFGEPKLYRLMPITAGTASLIGTDGNALSYNTLVHESRVIPFKGIEVSRRQQARSYNFGWGDSVLARAWRVIRDFDMSWDGAAHLMQDLAQGVLKIKGLYESVMSEDPTVQNGLASRMAALDYMRSLARVLCLDADGEDFKREATPLSGLADLLDRFCNRLSVTANTPVTRLFGQSPAGLSATGDHDIRMHYEHVEFERTVELRPALERIALLTMLAKDGPTKGKVLDGWSIRLPSLWDLTEVEEAQVRLAHAQADQIEITEGVVTPQEVADSRHGGDMWSSHTVLDKQLREKFAAGSTVDPDADPEMNPDLASPNSVNPKSALQGAQITAMLEIVRAVAEGEIPRTSGVQMIAQTFPVSADDAEKIVGDAGKGFAPRTQPPAAGAAGSAGLLPGTPGAAPPGSPAVPPAAAGKPAEQVQPPKTDAVPAPRKPRRGKS